MKTNEYISLAISLGAILCSVIALFHIYPRELGIDYLGIIVGILSFLTTLLLGWNIYTVVDFKEKTMILDSKRKEIEDIIYQLHKLDKQKSGFISDALGDIHLQVLDDTAIDGRECNYLTYKVHALASYAYIANIDTCNRIVDEMIVFLLSEKAKKITCEECEIILVVLKDVKNKKMIHNFLALHKILSQHLKATLDIQE